MSYQDDAITGSVESFGGTPIAAGELLDLGAGAPLFPQPFAIAEDLDAAHVRADGQVLMSTATLSTFDSTNYFGGDIILYDPVADSASLFCSRTNFASSASNVDALFLIESGADAGKLLLSTTASATLGGEKLAREDIVRYDPLGRGRRRSSSTASSSSTARSRRTSTPSRWSSPPAPWPRSPALRCSSPSEP